jgi:uncharacterized protein with HEPN domain
MSDAGLLHERLESVLEALERIPRRFSAVPSAEYFTLTDDGKDRLDAICMILIAVGEAIKQIDNNTKGAVLLKYPEIEWSGVMGVRDVIAHGYFDIDVEQVFDICQKDIPVLIGTVRKMLEDLR